MPRPIRRLRACLALAGLAALLAAGCGRTMGPPVVSKYLSSLANGPDVRVRIFSKTYLSQVILTLDGSLLLTTPEGEPLSRPARPRRAIFRWQKDQVTVSFSPPSKNQPPAAYPEVKIRPMDSPTAVFTVSLPELGLTRSFEGSGLDLLARGGGLCLINQLPLEIYIARVLPSEMDPDHFTAEALKAQAVVARTWALKNLGRHAHAGYNFCDGTHCQVYKGRRSVSRRAEYAVRKTMGQAITYGRNIAEAFYHSTCGGNTVFVHEIWGGEWEPYLSRVEDRWQDGHTPYCELSPYAHWTVRMSLRRLQRMSVGAALIAPRESLVDVKVAAVNRSGRVETVALITDRAWHSVPVDVFRRAFNREFRQTRILSKFFELQVDGQQFVLDGKGFGHGVGMCQWGARGMAQHGFTYDEILRHYFMGTHLAPGYFCPEPTENVQTSRE